MGRNKEEGPIRKDRGAERNDRSAIYVCARHREEGRKKNWRAYLDSSFRFLRGETLLRRERDATKRDRTQKSRGRDKVRYYAATDYKARRLGEKRK